MKRKWLVAILVVGALGSLVIGAVPLIGGVWLGKGLSSWRADHMTLEELSAKAASVTSRSLPQETDEGWVFASIDVTEGGVVGGFVRSGPFTSTAELRRSIDRLKGPMSERGCAHGWIQRIIEKGGVVRFEFEGVAAGVTLRESFSLDAGLCSRILSSG